MNKIICRKCGGEHLTIKCGKEEKPIVKEPEPQSIQSNYDKPNYDKQNNDNYQRPNYDKPNYDKPNYDKPRYRRDNLGYNKTYTVKLSELPLDITEPELYELLENWGHVTKIKVIIYTESSTAYIDFCYKEEADYFVEAINKTPFDSYIINAEVCVDRR